MKVAHYQAADLFCGAGGTSTGLVEACEEHGARVELTAINHWDVAIETHAKNHPGARHLCTSVDVVDPRKLFREGELDMLWASPECTHHSRARGGKPMNDQSRATAWCVVRWAEALRPAVILIENVKEFESWGPLGANGRPLKSRKGEVFHAWKSALEALGYRVEWRVLCAADYGDPTTRRRLFVYMVRGRRKIVWPEPTHAPKGEVDLFGSLKPWRSAREVIDFSLPSRSIYGRKKPLAAKTLNRIRIGLERYGLHPSIVCMEHKGSVRTAEEPLPTITTAKGGAMGVAQPFLIQVNHGNGADGDGDKRRVRSLSEPLPTVAGNRGEWALTEAFLIGQQSCAAPRTVDEPAPTVATSGAIGLCEPFLVEYYGQGEAGSINEPMSTITTKDRFGLAQPVIETEQGKFMLDVRFRMLREHELSKAQGFPNDYKFAGNKTQIVKQIGNAVPKNLSKALVRAALKEL